MSILSKFGVPLDGKNLGILAPKLTYRFRAVFQNFGQGSGLRELTQNVISCTRPKLTFADIKLDAYNSVGYIAGKHDKDPIELTLRDDMTNAVASAVGAQLQKQLNQFEQTSAAAGVNYKFQMQIDALDGSSGEALEAWSLEGCWIQSSEPSEGDYASHDGVQTFKLSIRYDVAVDLKGTNNYGGNLQGGNPYPNIISPTGGTTFG